MNVKLNVKQVAAAAAFGLAFAAPAFAQEVVKIGFSGPLSGGAALYGKNVLDGMQMAVAEINAAGFEVAGKKYKFEIVALDDKYNPSETAINAQRLVQESKTPAILVPHSGGGLALQVNNEQNKYLLLSYTSVPQITARGNKLTLRIPPEFTSYVPAFVKHAMTKYGKNLAFAHGDHDYAKAWTAVFKPAWEAAGGKVVIENPMSYNRAADFYSGVSRALAAKPDVMFIGGASEPTGLVVKQARELGFKGGFVIIDQAKMDEMAKVIGGYGPLEGSIGVLPLVEDKTPDAQNFVARFQKAYPGRIPSSEVSLNYTAVYLTAEAMKVAGTVTDATAIRAALDKAAKQLTPAHNPNSLDGVDEKGGTLADTRVAVIENGKVKEVKLSSLK
ncbi:ABC transporter substrate-binding protein [Piscinibacter gummiphilus]|uniref:Ethanolamine utilization protein EutJ n=1 Tax=Piscinibacter gummiphilus TaxID=946333 RepID=A0A1W6L4W4_9BURK|nr:ABC transporter substrate-binding protein [Piscinibacter gummiphilus]ARN19236.1 ethanolamine utilization protein EutJ [Piscinibacter gummiphilus]ATU63902.1 ethanolamine utilization protein EutJ [Piscinibacter gummiphilus]GLS93150.1 branched-chain amino acid ABC transporter substrate-binding protein [Piscinibacter gummiphilus]